MSAALIIAELEKLIATKTAIREAIIAGGAEVPDGTPFADYAPIILALAGDTVVPTFEITTEGTLDTVAAPSIGDTVTVTDTVFGPIPDAVSFVMQKRIPGQPWVTVAHDFEGGAYTFVADDMGREFTGLWTATRAGYTSRSYRSVAVAPLALVFVSDPTIAGVSRVGDTLTATVPVFPSDASLAYQWRIDGVAVGGQTAATYVPVLADRGKVPSVSITATVGAQTKTFVASAPAVVHAAPVVAATPSAIELTQDPGETATVSIGNVFSGIGLRYRLIERLIEPGDEIEWGEGGYVAEGYVAEGYVDAGTNALIGPPSVLVDPVTGALTVSLDEIRSGEITVEAWNEGGEAAVDILVSVVADAGTPAGPPDALEVGDWSVAAAMQTPTMAVARFTLSEIEPSDLHWTKTPPPASPAATIFVATGGSDAAAGTEGAPYATWQKAIDEASPGDVIEIAGGTYTIPSGVTWKSAGFGVVATETSGTSVAPIVMRSKAGERAVLDFSQVPSAAYAYGFMFDASHWRFERLDFTGWTRDDNAHFLIGARRRHRGQHEHGLRVRGMSLPWLRGHGLRGLQREQPDPDRLRRLRERRRRRRQRGRVLGLVGGGRLHADPVPGLRQRRRRFRSLGYGQPGHARHMLGIPQRLGAGHCDRLGRRHGLQAWARHGRHGRACRDQLPRGRKQANRV